MNPIIDLLNEIGMLALIPRSGLAFLGSGQQSVAEHSFRTIFVAYVLGRLSRQPIDMYKLIMMCLVHDLPETRTGDLNYLQKKYVIPQIDKVLKDLGSSSFLGPEIVSWIQEYEQGESLEAQLAYDADQLELLLLLKQEKELGNPRTETWITACLQRVRTEVGQRVADAICQTSSDAWYSQSILSSPRERT